MRHECNIFVQPTTLTVLYGASKRKETAHLTAALGVLQGEESENGEGADDWVSRQGSQFYSETMHFSGSGS